MIGGRPRIVKLYKLKARMRIERRAAAGQLRAGG
jgi:hypothetical protein